MRYNDGRKVLKMFIEFIEIKRVREAKRAETFE